MKLLLVLSHFGEQCVLPGAQQFVCPLCEGTGQVSNWDNWSGASENCTVCNGYCYIIVPEHINTDLTPWDEDQRNERVADQILARYKTNVPRDLSDWWLAVPKEAAS